MMLKKGVVPMATDTDTDTDTDMATAILLIQSILLIAKRNNNEK